MTDNAEAGIAQTQARAAAAQGSSGLEKFHDGNIAYLNDRIGTYSLLVAILGLAVSWAMLESPLLLYGSLLGVILLTVLWGLARIRRLDAQKRARAQQAANWQSGEN